MRSPKTWASAIALTMLGLPAAAAAQEPTAPADNASPSAEAPKSEGTQAEASASLSLTSADASASSSAPATTAPAAAEKPQTKGDSDHDGVVRRLGVGLLGGTNVLQLSPSNPNGNSVSLPLIGARYWLNERLGLQAGIGFAQSSGSSNVSTNAKSTPDETFWGMGLHLGAPYAFYYDQHYTLIAQPEANIAFGTGRLTDNANVTTSQAYSTGSWALDVGARIGAEIQFGFIGIPKLSLQGSVGLKYSLRQAAYKTFDSDGKEVKASVTKHSFGTDHYNDPWDLFIGGISALYYF